MFYQPGSSGVNVFSQDWSRHNNWLCPPVYLTCKVIKHMEICSAQGTLIVPLWKSAHFWPILCSDGFHGGLSMTGLSCLVCLVYLLEEKLRTQFLVASH